MRVGEPVDHGRYGILDHDDEGRVVCHLCGEGWEHLATHARLAHDVTAAEYRDRYGLPATIPLVGEITQGRMRAAWEARSDEHLAALDAHRDPAAAYRASRASQPRAEWAPAVKASRQAAARARRGPDLTPAQVARLGDGLDLQAWADGARTLQSEDGVTLAQLARAADITPATAGQRLRRYPPRTEET